MADRLGLITDARARMRTQARTGPKGKFPVRDMGRGICNQGGLARAESAPRGLRPFEDAAAGGDTRPTVVAVLYWRGGGNGPVCRRTRGET
jgi:hypothetical protein